MARTLDEIMAAPIRFDRARIEATTEEEIRQHAIEDGEDPDAELTFVKRRPGQRGPGKKGAMALVSLRLEPDVVERWQARGPGWRAEMRDVLTREAPRTKAR